MTDLHETVFFLHKKTGWKIFHPVNI